MDYKFCEELAAKFGDAYYIFREEAFVSNFNDFLKSFQSYYSNARIAYSYKTNYIPYLGQLIDRLGGYAEVTSELEYEIAIKNRVSGENIILNGPIHQQKFLERALQDGAFWNMDGFRQLEILQNICSKFPDQHFNIGLRLNIDIEEDFISRFGFDMENGDASRAIDMIKEIKNCEITGLHSHYWIKGRKATSFAYRLSKMIDFAKIKLSHVKLKQINVGGSFYGPLSDEIATQIDDTTPSYEDYGSAIGEIMDQAFSDKSVELIMEPGVALVGNTLDYYGRIYDIKNIKDKNFAVMEGSVHNVKPSLHRFDLKTSVYNREISAPKHYDLVGYTCLEYDYLRKNIFASIMIGDFVCIHDIGAYTITIKSPFIKGAPPILYIKDGDVKQLRKQEDFEHIFSTFEFDK